MNIRLETPKDYREVENLTREAFWNVYRPGCTEHYVLNQYRTNPDFIPELDFVMMEDDGKHQSPDHIIGHMMFSKAELVLDDGTIKPSWTFGPISIHPDYKRKGYGYFVADENPEAFEAYEATFPQKEKAFQEGQLPQFCQSCGMPLTRIDDCGTNADGSTNFDYCQYCYKDGKFLQECTMEEMIEHCAQFVDEVNKQMPKPMTKEEYKQMMRGFFPMLKRWKK